MRQKIEFVTPHYSVPQQLGFRASVLGCRIPVWRPESEMILSRAEEARAYVSSHLGQHGLLRTLIEVIRTFDLPWFDGARGRNDALYWHVGLPVDLLDLLEPPSNLPSGTNDVIRAVRTLLTGPPFEDECEEFVQSTRLNFRPSAPGFRVMPEDGSASVGMIRMQLPSFNAASGEGNGTAADMFRACIRQIRDVDFIVAIRDDQVERFAQILGQWRPARPVRIEIAAHRYLPTQWAQDNSKAGSITDESGQRRCVTLIPRYASQGEWESVLVLSDSLVFDSFSRAGVRVVQSPLLFQGGNLLPAVDPRTGERVLFMGEAEIWRNMALGLRRDEVIDAFRMEFGVDRCIVLPAVSFHIDLEVSVRACGGKLVAIVNDSEAAARHVIRLAIGTLSDGGLLGAAEAAALRSDLDGHADRRVLVALWKVLAGIRTESGTLPDSLAQHFGTTPAEDAAGNLWRFLLGLDLLTALALTDDELAHTQMAGERVEYYRLIREREADRRRLHRQLRELNIDVKPIPSLSDEEVSINYVNGVQSREWFLMPVLGGYFHSLDEAARASIAAAFGGDVVIVPVPSALSQYKYGGVHCSMAASPPCP